MGAILKVLILTPSVRPLGARRSLVELVRHLPTDVEPLVICPAKSGIYLELQELGVSVEHVPHGAWRKLGGRLTSVCRQVPAIGKIVGRFQPDAAHANEFHIVPQAFLGGKKKIPVCGHVRLSITPRQIRNYHLGDCRRIAVVSRAVGALFHETPMEPRVRVVYNGVDTSSISPDGEIHPEITAWLDSLGEPRPLVAGLLGLVSERKNQLVAVEALSQALDRGARVALLLAGDAFRGSVEYGDRLKKRLAEDERLARHVKWLPFQEDVALLYRALDVNLLISSQEGFGRTIIEAGAAARPSIGTRIGGIPELIDAGETGWLVDEGDADALAKILASAASQQDGIKKMGHAARQRVEANFTIDAHVKRMVEIWGECAEHLPCL